MLLGLQRVGQDLATKQRQQQPPLVERLFHGEGALSLYPYL